MSWLVACGGWLAAVTLVARLAAVRESAARASHEVRGPLAAALLALHGDDRPDDRAAAVAAQLERAARAVDDLGGRAHDRVEPLAAAALLASVAEAWRPVAAARGRRLAISPARAGLVIAGDRVRLAQAVGNLIANALEHGSGTVDVRPRVRAGALRIEVRDEGPGLPRPVETLVRRRRGGFGTRGRGLAIAATIAARHGGRLSAAPSQRGAAVALELPLAGIDAALPAGEVAEP